MPVLPDDELRKILNYTNSILVHQDFSEDQIQSKLNAIARLFGRNDASLAQEILPKHSVSEPKTEPKLYLDDLDDSESELNQR